MNLFILDSDPQKAAAYHCDKHVIKMILETSQLLCAAHHVLGTNIDRMHLDKLTHIHHPCSLWVRESRDNYEWAYALGVSLLEEYTKRYQKHHAKEELYGLLKELPQGLPSKGLTPFQLVMPDQYKESCAVTAYRHYYKAEKSRFAKWKKNQPDWWEL